MKEGIIIFLIKKGGSRGGGQKGTICGGYKSISGPHDCPLTKVKKEAGGTTDGKKRQKGVARLSGQGDLERDNQAKGKKKIGEEVVLRMQRKRREVSSNPQECKVLIPNRRKEMVRGKGVRSLVRGPEKGGRKQALNL